MTNYLELNAFLKKNLSLRTGGQAKVLIRSGQVLVNGEVETRNRKKLFGGEKILVAGRTFIVE